LAETAELESARAEVDADTGLLLHGTKMLKLFLVMPWVRTGCIVCADSYFASISATAELKRLGLHFIEVVVKTPSRMFPQDYHLARLELSNQGEREGVSCKEEVMIHCSWMSFVWVDRNCCYFISTTSLLMDEAETYIRLRWRQVNTEDKMWFWRDLS
jgi:hypothetical protein